MKGSWYWWGRGYSRMSLYDIAAECFAHALLYYFSNITIQYFNFGYEWNTRAGTINVEENDPRKWKFNAVWAGFSVVKRIPTIKSSIIAKFGYLVWLAM